MRSLFLAAIVLAVTVAPAGAGDAALCPLTPGYPPPTVIDEGDDVLCLYPYRGPHRLVVPGTVHQ